MLATKGVSKDTVVRRLVQAARQAWWCKLVTLEEAIAEHLKSTPTDPSSRTMKLMSVSVDCRCI